jgi:SAM-dependent methyltransferase
VRVDEAQIKAFYEGHPMRMPAVPGVHGILETHNAFADRVAALRPELLLDAGCGGGYLGERLAPLCGAYYGVDLSHASLVLAKGRVPGGLFCQGSLCRMPYPDACFDCVVCEEVLEHIPDCDQAIAELGRVARPGGRVLIAMPNPLSPDMAYSFFIRGRYTGQPYEWPISRDRLEYHAGRAGLRVTEFFSLFHRPPLGRGMPRALHDGLMRVLEFASRVSGVPTGLIQFFSLTKDG